MATIDSIGNGSTGSYDATKDIKQNNETDPIKDLGSTANKLTMFPLDLDGKPEYRDVIVFTPVSHTIKVDKNERLLIKKTTEKINDHFFLPMPSNIVFDNNVQWENASLGLTGFLGEAMDSLQNNNQEVSKLLGSVKNFVTDPSEVIKNLNSEQITGLAQTIGGAFNSSRGKIFSQTLRNPHLEQLFNGVGFRSFTFNWKFTPKDDAESEILKLVIEKFKLYSYPELTNKKLQFKFPNYWAIQFMHKEGDAEFDLSAPKKGGIDNSTQYFRPHPFLPKIKRSVCSSVNANYTADGRWFSHRDGAPVSIDLSLAFTEAEIVTRSDIERGF